MAGFVHFLKVHPSHHTASIPDTDTPQTIFIPLFLAALLYVSLAHVILPFVRRHRSRYSQYLPISALNTNPSPNSWRTRLSDALYSLFVPTSWGRSRNLRVELHEDELFDDEEGEGMVGFDPIDERRREALEQRRSIMDEERLGRELEEGFKDDSGDESEEDERRRSLSQGREGRFY
jgi:hypothetical protein